MFKSVLVANRGEIACRVIRTLRALGIRSIAVYSDADANAKHVSEADEAVRIGPAPAIRSYLSIPAIIDAAKRTGAEAIHPGYGFLSENSEFAESCKKAGIVFIGPGVEALAMMGDKIRAKEHVSAAGVPVIRGVNSPGLTDTQLAGKAAEIGFPILIKPSAGGGGKGMEPVFKPEELGDALATARRVAKSSFGDDTLLLERLVSSPRHIEVQLMADSHGNVIHLGERECSLQRRHQKVIEEAPSVLLSEDTRARIGEAACTVARSVNYLGAGTVEFLVSDDKPDEFFFMEMNTRLQVEHPVTEMVTGLDLVEWQLRVAAGEVLTIQQEDVKLNGHAIEARVYAEDPERGFLPSTGTVLEYSEASGEGIRIDGAIKKGAVVPPDYDPMLAKVIAWATTRDQALARLDTALAETEVLGLRTNIEYLRMLLADEAVRAGKLDTTLIERKLPELQFRKPDAALLCAAAVWLSETRQKSAKTTPWTAARGWRFGGATASVTIQFQIAPGETKQVSLDGQFATVDGETHKVVRISDSQFEIDSVESRWSFALDGETASAGQSLWAGQAGFSLPLVDVSREARVAKLLEERQLEGKPASPELRSPMPGTVVAVAVSDGDQVEVGQTIASIEAMKMEHKLVAPIAGSAKLRVKVGDLVKLDQIVATIEVEGAEA
ncbi:MAG: acetyl/propionyl/methylcrotonyl-CoA carboxylase subunit alpha [Microbacteriaceae bacterium]|nr:acetyl/propionyl/methylcrotonyl-CoA carboxylase subunit alpha [Microbacteriaceae bacterium]